MHKMDRRKFCKTSFSTAIAMGVSGYLAGCHKNDTSLPPSDGITARAATTTGDNLGAMTRDVIDAGECTKTEIIIAVA